MTENIEQCRSYVEHRFCPDNAGSPAVKRAACDPHAGQQELFSAEEEHSHHLDSYRLLST